MAQTIKIATFNAEWMVKLFTPGKPTLLKKAAKTPGLGAAPKNPQGVLDRIAGVIGAVDADIIGICEGPPLHEQMKCFVKEKLDNQYWTYSMPDGQQSVHALVHKRTKDLFKITQLPKDDKVFERLRTARAFYKLGSVQKAEESRFTRLPVILRLTRKERTTELMVVHTKSKFSSLKTADQWKKKNKEAIVSAVFARQKLSMEMNAIRKYIAHRLYSQDAESVIVMGDVNDGISRDPVDEQYLLHSVVHELRGAFHHEIALMRHVFDSATLQRRGQTWTVRFKDPANDGRLTKVLLDHIIYSPKCHAGGNVCFSRGSGRIETAAFDKFVENNAKTRDDRPSDHRPVSARFLVR